MLILYVILQSFILIVQNIDIQYSSTHLSFFYFIFHQLWTSDNAADEGEGGDGGEN